MRGVKEERGGGAECIMGGLPPLQAGAVWCAWSIFSHKMWGLVIWRAAALRKVSVIWAAELLMMQSNVRKRSLQSTEKKSHRPTCSHSVSSAVIHLQDATEAPAPTTTFPLLTVFLKLVLLLILLLLHSCLLVQGCCRGHTHPRSAVSLWPGEVVLMVLQRPHQSLWSTTEKKEEKKSRANGMTAHFCCAVFISEWWM